MYEDHLLLHFETAPQQHIDTATAARALLDWVDLAQRTISAIDPEDRAVLEIVGVFPGSTRFPQIMRILNRHTGDIKRSWQRYPHLKSLVVGASHTLYTSIVAAGVSLAMQPSEQTVRLSDDDRQILRDMESRAARDPGVRDASMRLYRTLETDPAITGVGVGNDWGKRPAVIIPREEFPERGGLWEIEQDAAEVSARREVWDVVLLRLALVGRPTTWQFSRGGVQFSALMADPQFLLAIHDGRVALPLREGVEMRVEVEYKVERNGELWEVVPRSRKIVRVLSPAPHPQPSPNNPGGR